MKIYLSIICFLLLVSSFAKGQNVTCPTLIEYVKAKGILKESVSVLQLINSAWLKEVTAYSIENSIVVIAKIKIDEFDFNTKEYIFCGLPSANWDAFYYGLNDITNTYGERFHKYIMDYKCNCN